MLYAFFWVIPQRLNFICQRFVTLCLFHLYKRVGMKNEWDLEFWGTQHSQPQTEGSETLAYKTQTPWNYPEESIQYFIF
jgi:hypothetical protein